MKKRGSIFENPFVGYFIFISIILICIASFFVEWLWFVKSFLSLLGKEVLALFIIAFSIAFVAYTYYYIKGSFSLLKKKSSSATRKRTLIIFENLTYLIISEILLISLIYIYISPLIRDDFKDYENPFFYFFILNIIILPFVFYYFFLSQIKALKQALFSEKLFLTIGLNQVILDLDSKIKLYPKLYETFLEDYFFIMLQETNLKQKQHQIKNIETQLELILKMQDLEKIQQIQSEVYKKLADEFYDVRNNFQNYENQDI
jgi:hypothetical protein